MCSHGLYIKCISIRAAPSEKLQKRRQVEKEAKKGRHVSRCGKVRQHLIVNDLRQIVRHELLVEIEAYLRP